MTASADRHTDPATRKIFLGRQAIYDGHRRIHGYELLFRRAETSAADVIDGNFATGQLLLNTLHIGMNEVSPQEPLFINCTRDFLMSDPLLPPDRCVLEILEDVEIDNDLLNRMEQLRAAGYRLALDDFTYAEKLTPAIRLADYVKLDVLALPEDQLREHVDLLRRFQVLLIAEKIDSESQLAECRKLGFDLFQGYYLRRPDVLSGRQMKTGKLAALRVLSECQKPNLSMKQIAAIITTDVSMTYSLLQLANSAIFGGAGRVECVSQAVTRLGTDRIVRWASLLILASDPDCPTGYVEYALQRAYMCERLSVIRRLDNPEKFYLAGLLSVLDSIIGVPMPNIVQQLPLANEVRDALVQQEGKIGEVLQIILAYESGDWNTVMNSGVDLESVRKAYWQSVRDASQTTRSLLAERE